MRRVILASQLEGALAGADLVSTGQDLDFSEQDTPLTSPSEQICEMGSLGEFWDDKFTYNDAITENILANRARQRIAWGYRKRLCKREVSNLSYSYMKIQMRDSRRRTPLVLDIGEGMPGTSLPTVGTPLLLHHCRTFQNYLVKISIF